MSPSRRQGRSAAAGFAAGPLTVIAEQRQGERVAGSPDEEHRRLSEAIILALHQLETLQQRAEGDGADILAFQSAMLEDPELAAPAFSLIAEGSPAEAAWGAALSAEI